VADSGRPSSRFGEQAPEIMKSWGTTVLFAAMRDALSGRSRARPCAGAGLCPQGTALGAAGFGVAGFDWESERAETRRP